MNTFLAQMMHYTANIVNMTNPCNKILPYWSILEQRFPFTTLITKRKTFILTPILCQGSTTLMAACPGLSMWPVRTLAPAPGAARTGAGTVRAAQGPGLISASCWWSRRRTMWRPGRRQSTWVYWTSIYGIRYGHVSTNSSKIKICKQISVKNCICSTKVILE